MFPEQKNNIFDYTLHSYVLHDLKYGRDFDHFGLSHVMFVYSGLTLSVGFRIF